MASNGDVANKIGTLSLAISAQFFGVPFYCAIPTTTIDWKIKSGEEIPIELRKASEMCTSVNGKRVPPEGLLINSFTYLDLKSRFQNLCFRH